MDTCDYITFSGVFTNDERKYKRADCGLPEGCIYPAKYCAVKHQNEQVNSKTYEVMSI